MIRIPLNTIYIFSLFGEYIYVYGDYQKNKNINSFKTKKRE